MIRFGSVCSGIEAASVAWHPLGWKTAWVADIDPFASALLAHHYPDTHNYGDFTQIGADAPAIDVLVGGTPCQSFSVAGLRGGLDDDRGNLALEFCRLADRLRPRWIVWENVPGVLSSNGGRDFGSILGAMGELGYGTAYRVLDAQYFGIPQRRRRVFVVGYSGDWRRAAAVLFERHSLSGYPPPSRKTGQSFTHELAPSLTSSGRGVERSGESRGQDPVIAVPLLEIGCGTTSRGEGPNGCGIGEPGDPMFTLQSSHQHGVFAVTPPLTSNPYGDHVSREGLLTVVGALGSQHTPNGHGQSGVNLQAAAAGHILPVCRELAGTLKQRMRGATDEVMDNLIAFSCKDHGADASEVSPTLRAMEFDGSHANGGGQVAVAHCLGIRNSKGTDERGDGSSNLQAVGSAVRRLTPLECERLQGFPDGYTAIPYRGKPAADSNRYRSVGNSMAVPVMFWIGKRIQEVDKLPSPDQTPPGQKTQETPRFSQANDVPAHERKESRTHGDY